MPGMVPVGIGAVMPRDRAPAGAVVSAGTIGIVITPRFTVRDRATTRVPLRRFISRRGIRPIRRVRRFISRRGIRPIRRLNKPRGGGQRVKRSSRTAGYG